ncbi:SHOCT domain-containing protein [Myxococcus llanfairpwllgwyngyllgogerychwyrndrobwllllantysiliogogogochensis]|uniref:SHOCT domain-containing protein n=1 Tax=Myxococcus llanfairpwllgwyngyllgogerychwyrndrobwllllantysiliogogogochensis TaxID=2590453 RepID=A0A540WJE7_9BACT|nr:SHOCT domain-containing protein [Myxococcus llanfairpwllgwyngyllgogerychwyrndrobwllllantysiliogogogochensis]TQF09146.1 SHOCT domain-containing protein [Myxococcus llanfairpwllgwyngyllgogerychwyrndrobwllllantysiliogogogochensis]
MMELDNVRLSLMGGWAVFAVGCCWFFGYWLHSRWKHEQVRQHGIPAEATLLRLERTAMRINKATVYNHLLQVRVPGRAPYEVWLRSRAHDWNVRVMEPGLELKVKVAPEDPNRVAVMGPLVPQDLGHLVRLMTQPPVPPPPADPVKALTDLQRMAGAGLITTEEFEQKKAEILARL